MIIRIYGSKNILRIFSALNRKKNKNTQPGTEKQYSYKKKSVVIELSSKRRIFCRLVYAVNDKREALYVPEQ